MSSGRDRSALGLAGIAVLVACKGASAPARSDDAAGSARAVPHIRAAPAVAAPAPPPAPVQPVADRPGVVALEEPRIDLPKQESFTLINAGAADRAVLRYTLAAGTVSFTAQTTLSSRRLDGGAFARPVALPAIRDGFAVATTDLPGLLLLRPLAGEAAVKSADAEAYLAPWRTLLENRRITVAIDDRGAFSAIRFLDDPTGARSERARHELVQRLLALIVPLPAEPVGPGASWRVVTILRQGPAYAKQTATYALTSRTPSGWKLRVKLMRVGEEQRIADPALPRGTTADLVALFRVLEGDVEVDPKRPLIARGALAIESRLHVRLQAPGQSAAQASEQIFEDTGTVALSHQ